MSSVIQPVDKIQGEREDNAKDDEVFHGLSAVIQNDIV
jgi:hypothetical protein